MLRNFRIKTRLIAGFALLVLISIIMCAQSYLALEKLNSEGDKIYTQGSVPLSYVQTCGGAVAAPEDQPLRCCAC